MLNLHRDYFPYKFNFAKYPKPFKTQIYDINTDSLYYYYILIKYKTGRKKTIEQLINSLKHQDLKEDIEELIFLMNVS